MLAVGPMANALVLAGWEANPLNLYVDVGSALDEVLKGERTRPYMDPASHYARHRCVPHADGRGRLGAWEGPGGDGRQPHRAPVRVGQARLYVAHAVERRVPAEVRVAEYMQVGAQLLYALLQVV